jgi:predicted nucleic acid-binding protein
MPVVVSDTTPLHYLIVVEKEFILEKLYGKLIIPPAVLAELGHAAAPIKISSWASRVPAWVMVATPKSIPEKYSGLDLGERQALALAKEIRADLILLDDKVARRTAQQEGLKIKGTLGIIAEAANAKLLDFVETVRKVQATSMHLDQELVEEVIRQYELMRKMQ